MKNKLKIFGLVMIGFVMLASTGCGGTQSVSQTITQKDSVFITETVVERDTVLFTQATTVTEYVTVPCPEAFKTDFKPVLKRQNNATLSLTPTEDGTLKAECECDTIAIAAKLRDKHRSEFRSEKAGVYKTTEPKPVRYTPQWIKTFAWIGGGTVALCGGIFIKNAVKIFGR
ncbi:MAG: hypothetical protein M9892_04595 [Bacteroidetes bacterium]|nr:hypothetical protein [Bacteroidota bacterium]